MRNNWPQFYIDGYHSLGQDIAFCSETLCRGFVRTGSTGSAEPMDFENLCFGTRGF